MTEESMDLTPEDENPELDPGTEEGRQAEAGAESPSPAEETEGSMEDPGAESPPPAEETEGSMEGAAGPVQEPPEEPAAEDTTDWRTIGIVAIIGLVVILILVLLFSALGPGAGSQETPTPEPPGAPDARIEIQVPINGAILDTASPVVVSGTGASLPEGSVVVQAIDNSDTVLAEVATTIVSPDAGTGGEGPWSVQLAIQAAPATPGRIIAFSLSPVDGSTVASDSVEVSFGATAPVQSFIEIQSPADGSVVDISVPVAVSGMAGGLFEGNVVVQAVGSDNAVLVETATIIQAPDAGTGGSGPWTTSLSIEAAPGSTGQIIAYSTSPEDGSTIASDTINVTYGTEEPVPTEEPETPETSQVNIGEHHWVALLVGGAPVLEATQVGADFGADGQVTGFAGCNSYFGPYEISGNSLTIGQIGSTRIACAQPEGVMEQESTYLGFLPTSATYSVTPSGGQLVVNDGSGAEILVYNAGVTGVVTYLPSITIPDDAIVTVQLQDVSLQDVAADILGQDEIQTNGQQVPIPYTVLYDSTRIQPNRTYSMSARITDGAGNLLLISDTIIPVLTNGSPTHDVEILTVQVP